MREFGAVNRSNWRLLLTVLANPWILAGIVLLILFSCSYLTALSWADLTYVLPASAVSYIVMAALGKLFLQENVPPAHWLGIGLVTVGVGVVAGGPSHTTPSQQPRSDLRAPREVA